MNNFWIRIREFTSSLRNKKAFHLLVFLILLLAVPLTVVVAGQQQEIRQRASENTTQQDAVPELTRQLVQSQEEYSKASPVEKKRKLNSLVAIALRRQQELLKNINSNPELVLEQATLADKRQNYPAEVQQYLEEDKDLSGEVTVLHMDDFKNKKEETHYYLKSEGKRYSLHFVKGNPGLYTGSKISVRGKLINFHIVLPNTLQPKESQNSQLGYFVISLRVPPGASGDQSTIVMLVNFDNDASQPVSTADILNLMFSNNNPSSVNNFYKENSFGKTSFYGDVVGWYTVKHLDCNSGPDYSLDLDIYAGRADEKAVQAGIDVYNYMRKVYIFPHQPCDYYPSGAGDIGGVPGTHIVQTHAWIFGTSDPYVFEHELGHNLGVHHANLLDCHDKPIDVYSNCTSREYLDRTDVMGLGGQVQFNGPHKAAVGWIPASNIQVVTTPGTFTIAPTEAANSNGLAQLIKVPLVFGGSSYYYISYRVKTGFDRNLEGNTSSGVSIHIFNDVPSVQTKMINTHPDSADPYAAAANAPLADGESFVDNIRGITVKQLSHNAASATFKVEFSPTYSPSPTPIQIQGAPISIKSGFNLIGITVDKGQDYSNSPGLFNDLSGQGFIESPSDYVMQTWDVVHQLPIYFCPRPAPCPSGYTSVSFPVVVGGAYLIHSPKAGNFTLRGAPVKGQNFVLRKGDNWISFANVPVSINSAEKLLQSINSSSPGSKPTILSKWDAGIGSYIVHSFKSNDGNDFPILAGEGYILKLNSATNQEYTYTILPETQRIPLQIGNNYIGLTIDPGSSYTADNLASDLKKSFCDKGNCSLPKTVPDDLISSVVRWDSSLQNWQTYLLNTNDGNNFQIKSGEGYIINSKAAGSAFLSGSQASQTSVSLNKSTNFVSFVTIPDSINKAEKLLQNIKSVGGDPISITMWSGAYTTHPVGSGANDFPLNLGVGYLIKMKSNFTYQIPR